jgi:CHAT domain-containing protein/Tfp pilus assembly protein PilF
MSGRIPSPFSFDVSRQRNIRLAFVLLAVLSASLLDSGKARAQQKPEGSQDGVTLELNKPIEREIASEQMHSYQIRLVEGQYASVRVEQRGIDVVSQVLGTDERLLAEFDDEMRTQGKEDIEVVAEATGNYMLGVKAKLKGVPAGSYEIRITEIRAATDNDRALQEARTLRTEFVRLHHIGKDDEALPFVERALAIAERVLGTDHVYVAMLVADLGNSYYAKSNSGKARPSYERALSILERKLGPEHPWTAYVTNRVAAAYWVSRATYSLGEVAKMGELLERALEVSEKTLGPEHPQVALCLHSLGMLHDTRGDKKKAEHLYQRALTIAEKTLETEESWFSGLLNSLGVLNVGRRDYERAEQFFQRSLTIKEKLFGPDYYSVADVLQNLGIVAREKKEYAKAEKYYLRALSIREKEVGPDHLDVAANLNSIANLYRAKGDYAKSLEIHLRALSIVEKTVGPTQWMTGLFLGNIAKTYAAMGDFTNAVRFQSRTEAAVETNIALNLVIGSERQKLIFLNTVSERTDRAISLNMQLMPGNPEASALATLVLLQRKGRVLDALTDTFAALRQRSDAQDRVLLDQLHETTTQLARLILSDPQKLSPEEHQAAVKDLEEKKEKLEAEISRRSAEFRAQSQTVTLEAVQQAIPSGAALVEFAAYRPFDPAAESNNEAYGESRYVAYVVRRQGVPQGKDLGEAAAIDRAIGALRQALRDPLKRDVRQLARAVDARVMQPIRALVGETTQLLISPDGQLNLIPFEALVDEQGRFLIQRYAFAYLTSGRDLLRLQIPRESRISSLVITNPLFGEPEITEMAKTDVAPMNVAARSERRQGVTAGSDLSSLYFPPLGGTTEEGRVIKSLFASSNLLTGSQATEAALKRIAAPPILHIATHGFFLQEAASIATKAESKTSATRAISASIKIENPLLRSGLALAGANLDRGSDDDGILTALEAAGLNLWGTKLVTLSACDTGVGEVKNGDGVYGLRRSFVLAGAETLVMSLWPVSDTVTRELMTAYYKELKQGSGRGEALRKVQLQMLKRNDRAHPFYWASFIQSGEWANLDGKR